MKRDILSLGVTHVKDRLVLLSHLFSMLLLFESFINSLKAGTLDSVLPVCAPLSRVLERNPSTPSQQGKGMKPGLLRFSVLSYPRTPK